MILLIGFLTVMLNLLLRASKLIGNSHLASLFDLNCPDFVIHVPFIRKSVQIGDPKNTLQLYLFYFK